MILKLRWAEKQKFWAFEKGIIQFFRNIWETKLKPFSGKVRESVENCLSQDLAKARFLENGFEVTFSSKRNVLSASKRYFSGFWKYLRDEVGTIFWEIEAKHSKMFKSKFSCRKILKKWFWSYLKLKNECCKCFNKVFFRFLQVFEWRSWNHFLGKWAKALKIVQSEICHRKVLRKWFSSYLYLKNESSESLKKVFFSFLQIFEWNRYLGKWGKAFKTIQIEIYLYGAS